MKRLLKLLGVVGVLIGATSSAQADLMLPDGTVTADTYYAGHGLNAYWAESVTTAAIDAVNLGTGQYIRVSGKITDISHHQSSWVEFGLIPKHRYDYWQTAFDGDWRPAVFDKGLYVVHWGDGTKLGLALQEGWDDRTSTTYHNKNGGNQPLAWDLAVPTVADPWDVAFTMDSAPTPSESYLSVVGETIYGTQPFPYGVDDGKPVANDNDYSSCYLIAQIWSNTDSASFSFEDVEATVVPTPAAVILGILGLGAAGLRLRKYV